MSVISAYIGVSELRDLCVIALGGTAGTLLFWRVYVQREGLVTRPRRHEHAAAVDRAAHQER